jgi:hypothetical protein
MDLLLLLVVVVFAIWLVHGTIRDRREAYETMERVLSETRNASHRIIEINSTTVDELRGLTEEFGKVGHSRHKLEERQQVALEAVLAKSKTLRDKAGPDRQAWDIFLQSVEGFFDLMGTEVERKNLRWGPLGPDYLLFESGEALGFIEAKAMQGTVVGAAQFPRDRWLVSDWGGDVWELSHTIESSKTRTESKTHH